MRLKGYFDYLKERLGGDSKYFMAALPLPAIPNEQLNNTVREKAGAVANFTYAELDNYTSQITGKLLTDIDTKYQLNESLAVLKDLKQTNLSGIMDTANRINGLFDANGQLNTSFLNNAFSSLEPMIKERLMGVVQEMKPYIMDEMKPYVAMGLAAMFVTIFSASYLGTALAMRSHRKRMGYNPKFYKKRKRFRRKDPLE